MDRVLHLCVCILCGLLTGSPPPYVPPSPPSCALWVKDSFWLRSALSLEPQYQFAGLRHEEEHLDYKDWQVPLGRRFRALKLWFVLRLYGAEKIRAYLQHQCVGERGGLVVNYVTWP